jgi:hypothetical protein
MDPDPDPNPDPAIFVIDLQDANKKQIKKKVFLLITFKGTVHLHHFSKIKNAKESQTIKNQGVYYYFCLLREGSESGSIHLTNGSGSGTLDCEKRTSATL